MKEDEYRFAMALAFSWVVIFISSMVALYLSSGFIGVMIIVGGGAIAVSSQLFNIYFTNKNPND